ncbi:MAG: hypothetical protein AAF216_11080 [Pseudomonadota bacterium]
MIDSLVSWASQPSTSVFVLVVAIAIILVKATEDSRTALWGDFFADEFEDE